ncbi:MAG: acylase, partial [Bacteroidetes bacterium]
DTSATLWPEKWQGIEKLPQVLNPPSGYVYNCNHTPFQSSGPADNPDPAKTPATMGFQPPENLNNRAVRFQALIKDYPTLSYEDFKRIKYDRAYNRPLLSAPKLEPIFHLSPEKYPDLAESARLLAEWDGETNIESEAAPLFILSLMYLSRKAPDPRFFKTGDWMNEARLVEALRYAQNHLVEHFGSARIPLEKFQRHIRGDVDLPVSGGPDVLAALYGELQDDGRLRATAGDSYIELVRFSDAGVEIESVNAFGASAKPESPHFTDQMDMYVHRKLKKMTLDKATVLKEAVRVYHPK